MMYLGDFPIDATVFVPWNTNAAAGESITRAADGSIRIYKNGSATQKTSANGITDTEDFDTVTGDHLVTIDTSVDTGDTGFWLPQSDYKVMVQGATIDGKSVSAWIGSFSIENRHFPGLLQRTTIATLATQVSFTLTAGSADNDAYNNSVIVVKDGTTAAQKAVGIISDYVGSTKTVTLSADPGIFTMAAGDFVEIIASNGAVRPSQLSSDTDLAAAFMAGGDIDGFKHEEAMKLILAMAVGVVAGADTSTTTFKAADGSKVRITATTDEAGNRSVVVKDVTG